MTSVIPQTLLPSSHSAFSLIDPVTAQLHRRYDRHGYLASGLRKHVAISYVWSEWKALPSDRLPDWDRLRSRLLSLVGPNAPNHLRAETWRASRCWLDCMCIDQASEDDKSYWVPRMDQIYSEARCTLLLLGLGHDLTPILHVKRSMSCKFKDSSKLTLVPHTCLLNPSCTRILDITAEQEQECIDALRRVSYSNWRRRAWILQEILLSEKYMLSWNNNGDWLLLDDIGVIATAFFYRHPSEQWICQLGDWCRRLWYLRQFHREGMHELNDANVLQLAYELEATIPSDKYFALCGILRLKSVKSDAKVSADQALHIVMRALFVQGRMSWLYAIPRALKETDLELQDGRMSPFVLTRSKEQLWIKANNTKCIDQTVSREAVPVGTIVRSEPLLEVFRNTFSLLKRTKDFSFPPDLAHFGQVPWIIRRLSLEIVEPLFVEPVFGKLCKMLGLERNVRSESRKAWLLVMLLSMLSADEMVGFEEEEEEDKNIIAAAAWSLQRHIESVQEQFNLVQWQSNAVENSGSVYPKTGVALAGCPKESLVFEIKGDSDLLFAAIPGKPLEHGEFYGMIYRLDMQSALGNPPSSLFTPFWKSWRKSANPRREPSILICYDTSVNKLTLKKSQETP